MTTDVRTGLTVPIFGPLAEPGVVAELAARAEDAGWDGCFVWDHVVYRRDPDGPDPHGRADLPVADPWITLAAIATATERVRLGPLVTPLPRRRPHVLARATTTLDRLSGGRLVLGVGIGGDGYGEFSDFGDEVDPRTRGAMLDERLDLLRALWSGEVVDFERDHARATDVVFHPRPVQRPGPPVWAAGRFPNRAPLRRAVGLDGFFPIDLDGPDDLAAVVTAARELRGDLDGWDLVAQGMPGDDPRPWVAAGATWWLTTLRPWGLDLDEVASVVDTGPPPVE
ncbi:TIGR03619 family F420-dependent LLM class oxidoreductase [Salsipaludibacter albus]|uniref:TIGR03619 family F420-dependent LLM class oxidoreductase n=1 Tax=Salsipaludibacter albus TaxID=2849650 RepID=UPI001EE4E262|nr:TIGR03619 family F420-dependent LLM class oxidoreductase [Salsipaludibacter albus]MBY5162706.1 TIGR03619 family F420-dependent LLM class oxidoreductase [Salsipaludibacter albus]